MLPNYTFQIMNAEVPTLPPVVIVLLNWNNSEDTRMALDSLQKMDYPNASALIIDNGSTDGSVPKLREMVGAGVELIELPENSGYTGGCNVGMRRALEMGAQYVWLLNNDSVVPAHALRSMVAVAEGDPKIGLVAPMIASLGDAPHMTYAGGVVYVEVRRYDETNDPDEARVWERRYPGKELALGTAMLVRGSLIREIGFLDERFFAYYEDIDYSARSIGAGYRNVIDRAVVIQHFEKNRDITPLEMKPHYWYYMARNESRFWRKHVGFVRSLRPTAGAFLRYIRNLNACKSKPMSTQAILAGLWHGWWDRGGPYDSRYRMPWVVRRIVWAVARRGKYQVTERDVVRIPVRQVAD